MRISPLQKLLDARQTTEAARQALRRAEQAEAIADAELAALHVMCNADTVRPPRGATPDLDGGWS